MPQGYPAEIEVDEEGRHVITFPNVPEVTADGAMLDEAFVNGRRALRHGLYLYAEDGEPMPKPSGPRPGQPVVEVTDEVIARIVAQVEADNAADITAIEEGRRREADGEVYTPHEVLKRVLDGEHPIEHGGSIAV